MLSVGAEPLGGRLRPSQVIVDTGATESACGIRTMEKFLESSGCRYDVYLRDWPTFRYQTPAQSSGQRPTTMNTAAASQRLAPTCTERRNQGHLDNEALAKATPKRTAMRHGRTQANQREGGRTMENDPTGAENRIRAGTGAPFARRKEQHHILYGNEHVTMTLLLTSGSNHTISL